MQLEDLFSAQPAEAVLSTAECGCPFPYLSMGRRLGALAESCPDRPAIVDGEGSTTYAQLVLHARRVAAFILGLHLPQQTPVAVLTGRNRYHFVGVLGIWMAGAVSIPLDPTLPGGRLALMLEDCAAPLLLTDAEHAGQGERISFLCPNLSRLLCLDLPHFEDAVEQPGDLMNAELWEQVTRKGSDGSWKSYFTGLPLAAGALQGMARNVCSKIAPWLGRDARILDVGGGSGAVARALLSRSACYVTVDLSEHELEHVRKLGREMRTTVKACPMEARDIGMLDPGFDVVVINSVIENFPGCNYLRQVLDRTVALLVPGGACLVGMVWDASKRETMHEALRAAANSSALTRFEAGQELFVPRSIFEEWASRRGDVRLEFSQPESGVEELDAYRYDVLIRKENPTLSSTFPQRRFGLSDLPQAMENLHDPGAGDPCYVIYTSGTTGRPKGVVACHGGLMNLMDNLLEQVWDPLRCPDRPLRGVVLASFSFDASEQAWAALCAGGTLFPAADALRRDPRALHEFLRRRGPIDVCDGTPSLFGLLLDYWEQHACHPDVRTWLLGGESMQTDLPARLYALPGQEKTRIINAYGPTECTVDATLCILEAQTWKQHAVIPVGRAIRGILAEVRDGSGHPVQDGIPGELWIGGAGVAKGYLGQTPASTRFVEQDGLRWYRSGDIMYRRDGLLFYLSREDGQVKTGGYRVEISEVEAVLEACPLVGRAAVRAGDFSGNGLVTLAAYVTPAHGQSVMPDAAALRDYLSNHLPAYAIPSLFVFLERLPLTGSGKVDRRSLPSPTAHPLDAKGGREPRGAVESGLAEIWSRLLGVPVRDAEADFFSLGGHSVLGVRLLSLIERNFGRRLTLSALFVHPTIAAQAQLLARAAEGDSGPVRLFELCPGAVSDGLAMPFFLIHPSMGSAFCFHELAQCLGTEFPLYALEPELPRGQGGAIPSLENMAAEYARVILSALERFEPDQPYLLGGWSFGGLIAFEAARCLRGQGRPERGLVLLDTALNAARRSRLVQMDDAEFILAVLGDDLAVDRSTFAAMDGEARLSFLLREGEKAGLLPAGFGTEDMVALGRLLRHNALAAARYHPRPLEGRGLLVRARIVDDLIRSEDLHLGWRQWLSKGVELCWSEGTHVSMLQKQNVEKTAQAIRLYGRRCL